MSWEHIDSLAEGDFQNSSLCIEPISSIEIKMLDMYFYFFHYLDTIYMWVCMCVWGNYCAIFLEFLQ